MRGWFVGAAMATYACVVSASIASETTTYTYDELGRLISSSNSGGPRNGKSALTSYDSAGNRATHAVGMPAPAPNNSAIFSVSGPSAAVNEGQTATFTVSKSGPASSTLSVQYQTASGTASAPGDFAAASGTLNFLHWETIKTVSIPVLDDGIAEPLETFALSLSSPSAGASIGTASASAQINASAAANQPPITSPDSVSVKVCMSTTKNVTANDIDPEGGALTLVSVSGSSVASLLVESASNIRVSAYGSPGSQVVTYVVKDAQGLTSTGSLTVTVTNGTGCN